VEQLLSLLDAASEMPWQTRTVAINSLGRVGRHNPHLIAIIESVLTSACNRNVATAQGLSEWEAYSVASTVKSTLQDVVNLCFCPQSFQLPVLVSSDELKISFCLSWHHVSRWRSLDTPSTYCGCQ